MAQRRVFELRLFVDLVGGRKGLHPRYAFFPQVMVARDPGMQGPGEDGQAADGQALFVQFGDEGLGEILGRRQEGRLAQEPVHQWAGDIAVIGRLQAVWTQIQPVERLGDEADMPLDLARLGQGFVIAPDRAAQLLLAGQDQVAVMGGALKGAECGLAAGLVHIHQQVFLGEIDHGGEAGFIHHLGTAALREQRVAVIGSNRAVQLFHKDTVTAARRDLNVHGVYLSKASLPNMGRFAADFQPLRPQRGSHLRDCAVRCRAPGGRPRLRRGLPGPTGGWEFSIHRRRAGAPPAFCVSGVTEVDRGGCHTMRITSLLIAST